ncbi:CaiB/BaiF CoA-transferase family protein [Bradyrhizobium sp. AS23.2]|uniref:CaiB/BaiF CoA transferase family protein n=1 Tax=Bradyrhizobium sp. AS23.2 TaxID=1680155 RepID=UPI0009F9C2FA|nr:CaiB/BaiF CoA-transferase family protein [Bradyrhizobium sp. AS23.2]
MAKPLTGVLVVAIEQAVAAPFASCRLADAGARVIKIERPEGDFTRGYDGAIRGESTYYVWVNRGKESVVLDFRKAEDAALLQSLISRADVVIQNLGPGAAERGGFGSEKLRAARPELITCDITGYGETGPMKDMRAYDLMVQAESGIAYVTGSPSEPGRVGVSACDVATGMYAHAAILEALVRRGQTGEGASIHVSLFESMADWMTVPLLTYEHAGRDWPRTGLGHPLIVPYGAYHTRNGSVLVSVQNHREWQRFCEFVLENTAVVEDPRFATNQDRTRNKEELNIIIDAVMSTLTLEEAIQRLSCADLAYARVNDVAALSRHSQLRRASVDTPAGPVDIVAPPATFRRETRDLGAVPALGQHTAAVRSEFAE